MMVACGSDSDDNSPVDLTENQIIEYLTGQWDVYGEIYYNITSQDFSNPGEYSENYEGKIEFKSNKAVKTKISFIDDYWKYSILKKNGDYYISFNYGDLDFKILSITKTSFKLVCDQDITSSDGQIIYGHQIITMNSR